MEKDKKPSSASDLHKNHRKRLFARYSRDGFDSFEEHNILELLLFYSIPRADTNPTAHNLINRFGSLYGVLTAPPEELVKVDGVGPASAQLLHAIFDSARTANLHRLCESPIKDYDRLLKVAVEWMAGRDAGTSAVILLNNRNEVQDIAVLASRHVTTPPSYPEAVLELARKYAASKVVLMHNHPDAVLRPSASDRCMTADIYRFLKDNGVQLMEHLIVHEFDVNPILDESMCETVSGFPRAYL